MKFEFFKKVLLCTLLLFSAAADAVEMNVPKDELAQETVYPIFDNPIAVKNRNIQDKNTFDIGVFSGLAITEPIANTLRYGFAVNYHLSEIHSFGAMWAMHSTGLSKDAEGLKSDFGLDFGRAPYPQYSLMGDYNYKMYYGKLSVTRTGVINTSIYMSGSAGMIKYVHKSYPAVAVGVGERFYFNSHVALKVDLRFGLNSAPIPFKSGALRVGVDPVPSYDDFSERLTTTIGLELGLNYLF